MIRQYPVSDKVEGWYFRVQEVSVGSFLVEGRDVYGRQVSRTGISDPDEMLCECIEFARAAVASANGNSEQASGGNA